MSEEECSDAGIDKILSYRRVPHMATSGKLSIMKAQEAKELMETILGRKKADLAVTNAIVANVYTGELWEDCTVTVKGKWIATVGKGQPDMIGEKTAVIDAQGMTVIPGLIDGHTHLAPLFDAGEFSCYALKSGTTTVIAETMEAFPIGGYEAVLDYLESLSNQPIKFYATAAAMVSISRVCRGMPLAILKKLLKRQDIVGLGESYWQGLIQDPELLLPLYEETRRHGKVVEGHTAGASGNKLMAYLATGVSSCHEPISAEEVLERLRLGIYVMVREGSIRRELEALSSLQASGVDLRRLILVTDGIDPKDLLEKGYMEFVVQKAIACGFSPMDALRMATLNVAEHFGLDGRLGGIAPGKYADMVIIPDIKTIRPVYVISNGRIAARNGEVLVSPRKPVYSKAALASVHIPEPLKAEDFSLPIPGNVPRVKVRVIDQITDLVTAEAQIEMPVRDGEIKVDLERDLIKVAAIDRAHQQGKRFVGLLRGFHMRAGAFATSAAWDTSDIVVVGVKDQDMAEAVNRLRTLQGGTVIYAEGKMLAEFPLPILGLISPLPMEALAEKMAEIVAAAGSLGLPFANPFLTLMTLTGAAIPYLRICEEGLVNLKDGKTLGLIVESV